MLGADSDEYVGALMERSISGARVAVRDGGIDELGIALPLMELVPSRPVSCSGDWVCGSAGTVATLVGSLVMSVTGPNRSSDAVRWRARCAAEISAWIVDASTNRCSVCCT